MRGPINNRRHFGYVFAAVLLIVLPTACGKSNATKARDTARDNSSSYHWYVPHNEVEMRNINWKQEIADDPATIMWCTFSWPGFAGASDNSAAGNLVTIPIAGKLTSSGKRPFPALDGSGDENPGSDGTYGSSSDYRYGFGPEGKADYTDFYLMPSICTTQPKIWQANTTIITNTDTTLQSLSDAASAALKSGDAKKAQQILDRAGNVTKEHN